MRAMMAALVGAFVLSAPAPGAAQDQPGWSYAYNDGVATATQRDDRGRVTATLSCRPPDGDIILADFTLARSARRAETAAVQLGALTINVPMRVERQGRQRAVVIHLPQRPPILAGAQPSDRLVVTVNDRAHTYLAGSGTKLREIAHACWGG